MNVDTGEFRAIQILADEADGLRRALAERDGTEPSDWFARRRRAERLMDRYEAAAAGALDPLLVHEFRSFAKAVAKIDWETALIGDEREARGYRRGRQDAARESRPRSTTGRQGGHVRPRGNRGGQLGQVTGEAPVAVLRLAAAAGAGEQVTR